MPETEIIRPFTCTLMLGAVRQTYQQDLPPSIITQLLHML